MTSQRLEPWFAALYDAVTAQLEHELDALGYDGNVEGVESLERIKTAVADVNAKRHAAGPLNLRLRAEAAEWDKGEPLILLLDEAAGAIEALAATLALSEFNRAHLAATLALSEFNRAHLAEAAAAFVGQVDSDVRTWGEDHLPARTEIARHELSEALSRTSHAEPEA